ncbi:hypothetical protein L7F22_005718 [Adiantum nelumboides]|nr:hypothetical protein [Adiantum nelumboides]
MGTDAIVDAMVVDACTDAIVDATIVNACTNDNVNAMEVNASTDSATDGNVNDGGIESIVHAVIDAILDASEAMSIDAIVEDTKGMEEEKGTDAAVEYMRGLGEEELTKRIPKIGSTVGNGDVAASVDTAKAGDRAVQSGEAMGEVVMAATDMKEENTHNTIEACIEQNNEAGKGIEVPLTKQSNWERQWENISWLLWTQKRFDVPLEILSDRGPCFRGDLVGELMKKLGIERRHSTSYYPQCNGLVEKINGMICKIIIKQVVSKPKDWDKHLSAALWAYMTSFRTSLGYTPYHLVFGKQAILPIEVQLASLKILATKNEETPNDQLKQRILDLEKLELDREMAIEYYTTQAERRLQKFNDGFKDKELKRGMLVLCYDNHFDTRKDKKFMSRWEEPYVVRKTYTNGSYRLQDISEVVVDLPPKTIEEEEEGGKAFFSRQLCKDKDLLEA